MKLFLDENITVKMRTVFHVCLREKAEHISEHFDLGTPDHDWLSALLARKPRPLVLTLDRQIVAGKSPILPALKETGLDFVIPTARYANMPFPEQCWRMIRYWPRVKERIRMGSGQGLFVNLLRGSIKTASLKRLTS